MLSQIPILISEFAFLHTKKNYGCAKKNIHNRFFDVPLEIKP